MRKIEIYEWKDFEQLENLEGSDYVYVKVHTESLPKKMAAISLKNFFGTLDLCLEPTLKRKVNVIDSSFSQAFFKDTFHCQVLMDERYRSFFQTGLETRVCDVYKQSFWQRLVSFNSSCFYLIRLYRDIIIDMPILIQGKIRANGHTIYVKKGIDFPFQVEDGNVCFVDEVFYIKRAKDLARLENFTSESVVLVFQSSLVGEQFESISLKHFFGSLYVLGENYQIRDCTIVSKEKFLALFSSLHPYGNVVIHDLTICSTKFVGENANVVGSFLGKRNQFTDRYQSSLGSLLFVHTHVKNCQFYSLEMPQVFSPFIGILFSEVEFIDSDAEDMSYFSLMDPSFKVEFPGLYFPLVASSFSSKFGRQEIYDPVLSRKKD